MHLPLAAWARRAPGRIAGALLHLRPAAAAPRACLPSRRFSVACSSHLAALRSSPLTGCRPLAALQLPEYVAACLITALLVLSGNWFTGAAHLVLLAYIVHLYIKRKVRRARTWCMQPRMCCNLCPALLKDVPGPRLGWGSCPPARQHRGCAVARAPLTPQHRRRRNGGRRCMWTAWTHSGSCPATSSSARCC
jgi:hypothetical protein